MSCDKIGDEVVLWAVKFDDGSTEKLQLNVLNKARWRILRVEGL